MRALDWRTVSSAFGRKKFIQFRLFLRGQAALLHFAGKRGVVRLFFIRKVEGKDVLGVFVGKTALLRSNARSMMSAPMVIPPIITGDRLRGSFFPAKRVGLLLSKTDGGIHRVARMI
jgi:hypothetical protein